MLKHSRITKYKCPVKGRIIIKVFKGYVFFAVSNIGTQVTINSKNNILIIILITQA